MSKVKVLTAMLSASVVTVAMVASPALAWHPEGVIKKYVQNQTTNSSKSDANDVNSAVAAKPGDVLKYTIEVSNKGQKHNQGWNDMANTVVTDNLPDGVVLESNPAQRTVTFNLGKIEAGKSKTAEFTVKVTSNKDGSIPNKACYTGETTNNEPQNAQKGCDVAVVTVKVPPVPPVTPEQPKPEAPKTPETPTPTPETPAELPNTGTSAVLGGLAGAGSLSLAGYHYLRSKRNLRSAHNR